MSGHECPRNGCTRSVSPGKLFCAEDWKAVPAPLQKALYRAWDRGRGAGSRAHRAAMAAAIRAVNGDPEPAPRPTMGQLWDQSGEDPERYRELLREHGYLLSPGDEGYEEGSRSLPCGWEPGKGGGSGG